MSGSSRTTCVVTLLLIFGSIAMPVYAAGAACVGMSCHADRSNKLGEPMSHDCCGTGDCFDAPPATADSKVTIAPLQQTDVLVVASQKVATVSSPRRAAAIPHSPPRETSSRLALLATLLI